jgi:hypothetical protein
MGEESLKIRPLPADVDDLQAEIAGSVTEVAPDQLRHTWIEIR